MLDFFRNTLSTWQWGLLSLVPLAIVALYFLKLRRQPLVVPSTYLWKRSIEDMHVNSLWQQLRQNLLLFLQLLLIGMAMLALLRPGWEGTKLVGERFIFLIDNSASMSATDEKSGKNRLDEAKTIVDGMIKQMSSGMAAMIVSFTDTPQVVQQFTDNTQLLRDRLATIKPTVRTTDLEGALQLASGLANQNRRQRNEAEPDNDASKTQPTKLYIVSDGRFAEVKNFSLGSLDPIYVPIGTLDAKNLAITAFVVQRSESKPEDKQAFVQVANFSQANRKTTLEIELDGTLLDAKEVEVPAGETSGVVFPLANVPVGKLMAHLKLDDNAAGRQDVLSLDNVAYAAINDTKPGRVLIVTPGNEALRMAFATQRSGRLANIQFHTPDVLTHDEYQRNAELGTYNLIVYDQCAPETLPRANTLFIGQLPPGKAWHGENTETGDTEKAGGNKEATENKPRLVKEPQIIDWDRSHPLLANVELGNVAIADSIVLHPPPGGTALIDSTEGTIAAIAPRDAYQDAVLGFEIVGHDATGATLPNTNWPRKVSFPTFFLNVLEYLGSAKQDSQLASTRPGRPIELQIPGNEAEWTVVDPDGKQFTLQRSEGDVYLFRDTNRLGIYEVQRGNQMIERFAVNLFDLQESDVAVRSTAASKGTTALPADIRVGSVEVAATVGQTPTRTELWKLFLGCALFALILEWYIYNRRVYL